MNEQELRIVKEARRLRLIRDLGFLGICVLTFIVSALLIIHEFIPVAAVVLFSGLVTPKLWERYWSERLKRHEDEVFKPAYDKSMNWHTFLYEYFE